jgi:hypothetical protein
MNRFLILFPLIALISCGQSKKSNNLKQVDKQIETSISIKTTKIEQESENDSLVENVDCSEINFNSAEQQGDSLLSYYKKATDSTLITRMKWEQKFFCAFPNSFKGMQSIFGYDEKSGAAPLYSIENNTHSYSDRYIMSDVIGYFSVLESIPDSTYFEKYVRINIDGYWEADNISEAFGFHNRLINDTKAASKALSQFTNEEVRSVFRFIFDGPHSKNEYNEEIFEILKQKIKQNERLGNLLNEAYSTLTAKDDGHGH